MNITHLEGFGTGPRKWQGQDREKGTLMPEAKDPVWVSLLADI